MSARLQLRAWLLVALLTAAGAMPDAARAEDALGRLFLTPEQRHALDQQRLRPAGRPDAELPGDLLPARAGAGRRVVLNGVIRRGQQEPLVWINGQPASVSAVPGSGLQVRRGPDSQNRVTVGVERAGAAARLKPGQAWDPASGEVSDCVQCDQPPLAPAADVPAATPAAEAAASLAAGFAVASADAPGAGPLKARNPP